MDVTYITWVVGVKKAPQAVLRLAGLRGRSATLGLQKAQLRVRNSSRGYWTLSESLIW